MNGNLSMTVSEWLKQSEDQLKSADIFTAHLDCLVLLEDETGKDRSWLLSHAEHKLQGLEIKVLNTKVAQRVQHVPLAYIRGKAEFYGREFAVNEHTLVPRPETETMIELLKTLHLAPKISVLDVGTGSGCIAITAALEMPELSVYACDIDENCIEIAWQNAKKLNAIVQFYSSDLLKKVPVSDVLLCNLPYVPEDFRINTAATHEPKHAIFGGGDGLAFYRQLFEQITTNSWKPRYILTESLPPQHMQLVDIAHTAGYSLRKTEDFVQLFTTS